MKRISIYLFIFFVSYSYAQTSKTVFKLNDNEVKNGNGLKISATDSNGTTLTPIIKDNLFIFEYPNEAIQINYEVKIYYGILEKNTYVYNLSYEIAYRKNDQPEIRYYEVKDRDLIRLTDSGITLNILDLINVDSEKYLD